MFKYVPRVDLAAAKDALQKAEALVLSVRQLFLGAGEVNGAARMLDIAGKRQSIKALPQNHEQPAP